ncbi:hypothetical protein [Vibrio sp. 2-2(2)]|nr:hypothetical protein [Vibrio sp. 2-2(2)]EGR2323846.1 hypothetical protein [Vibrio alginolyticus]NNN40416.1 hypothetical protein [Vibrio sp. 2-2(2)]
MNATEELIDLAKKYQNDGLCPLNAQKPDARTFIQLLTERTDKVLQTTFQASSYACLRKREETVLSIIKSNSDYFAKQHSKPESARIRDAIALKCFAFFLSRGNLLSALYVLLLCKFRNLSFIWSWLALPKLGASSLVGMLAVQSSSDLQRVLNLLVIKQGVISSLVTAFIFSTIFFSFMGFRYEKPRLRLFSGITRSIFPAFILLAYSYMFSFILDKTIGVELTPFYEGLLFGSSLEIPYNFVIASTIGSLYVGMFMQLVWDKDTVTAPL